MPEQPSFTERAVAKLRADDEPEPSAETIAAVADRLRAADAANAALPPEAATWRERLERLFSGQLGDYEPDAFDRLLIEMWEMEQDTVRGKLDEAHALAWNRKHANLRPILPEVFREIRERYVVRPKPKAQAPWTAEQARAYEQLMLDMAGQPVDNVRAYLQQKCVHPMYLAFKKSQQPKQRKWVRGVPYQGPPKDRSREDYYVAASKAVYDAVKDGDLYPVDHLVATFIRQHNRRTYRAKDKGRRITMLEIAAGCSVSLNTVKRSVTRLIASGVMEVESNGKHNRNGHIYRFPSRTEEAERAIIEQGFTRTADSREPSLNKDSRQESSDGSL